MCLKVFHISSGFSCVRNEVGNGLSLRGVAVLPEKRTMREGRWPRNSWIGSDLENLLALGLMALVEANSLAELLVPDRGVLVSGALEKCV